MMATVSFTSGLRTWHCNHTRSWGRSHQLEMSFAKGIYSLILLASSGGRILAVPPKTSKWTPLPNPLPFGRGEGERLVRWYRQDAPVTVRRAIHSLTR